MRGLHCANDRLIEPLPRWQLHVCQMHSVHAFPGYDADGRSRIPSSQKGEDVRQGYALSLHAGSGVLRTARNACLLKLLWFYLS